jgi:hypothetical protein
MARQQVVQVAPAPLHPSTPTQSGLRTHLPDGDASSSSYDECTGNRRISRWPSSPSGISVWKLRDLPLVPRSPAIRCYHATHDVASRSVLKCLNGYRNCDCRVPGQPGQGNSSVNPRRYGMVSMTPLSGKGGMSSRTTIRSSERSRW